MGSILKKLRHFVSLLAKKLWRWIAEIVSYWHEALLAAIEQLEREEATNAHSHSRSSPSSSSRRSRLPSPNRTHTKEQEMKDQQNAIVRSLEVEQELRELAAELRKSERPADEITAEIIDQAAYIAFRLLLGHAMTEGS